MAYSSKNSLFGKGRKLGDKRTSGSDARRNESGRLIDSGQGKILSQANAYGNKVGSGKLVGGSTLVGSGTLMALDQTTGEGKIRVAGTSGGVTARSSFGGAVAYAHAAESEKEGYSAVFSDKAAYDRSVDLVVARIKSGAVQPRKPDAD